ncbi:F-box domain-containing protein [Magnaporthiopsis poae ATCC 64411]|uniref:F-box domain-containing protein n=1 Tax=Magnaporthiopsis poae (strain ATCC 64411 / 73-15) TaxID=644358 RepID=A0A0C4DNH6_MAGP6|nr:F-box domain-containing protein [Magnaporthiopsis poae ATCC 64411]
MASDPATLESLPNEILLSVLSVFPAKALLPLSAVSRRFHAIVLRLLSNRLASAVSASNELILECYHPSAKLSTPYLHCKFLGTGPLDSGRCISRSAVDAGPAEGEVPEEGSERSLGQLRQLYSHFRPLPLEEGGRVGRRRRARAALQQLQQQDVTNGNATAPTNSGMEGEEEATPEPPSLDVNLDEAELFTQLCTVTNLVKLGPRHGLFSSHINISDGLIRVWRDWLGSAAAGDSQRRPGVDGKSRAGILWADPHKHVGVRFRVSEITDHWRAPLLVGVNDDPPVSYRLEYDELVVRTSHLLLTTEKSDMQEATSSDTAVFLNNKPKAVDFDPAQMLFYPCNIKLAPLLAHHFDRPKWACGSWRSTTTIA